MSGHQSICNRRPNNDVFKTCRNYGGTFTVKAYVTERQPGEFWTHYGNVIHVGRGRSKHNPHGKHKPPESYRVRVTPKPRSAPL